MGAVVGGAQPFDHRDGEPGEGPIPRRSSARAPPRSVSSDTPGSGMTARLVHAPSKVPGTATRRFRPQPVKIAEPGGPAWTACERNGQCHDAEAEIHRVCREQPRPNRRGRAADGGGRQCALLVGLRVEQTARRPGPHGEHEGRHVRERTDGESRGVRPGPSTRISPTNSATTMNGCGRAANGHSPPPGTGRARSPSGPPHPVAVRAQLGLQCVGLVPGHLDLEDGPVGGFVGREAGHRGIGHLSRSMPGRTSMQR